MAGANPNLSGNHGDHLNPKLHHVRGHHPPGILAYWWIANKAQSGRGSVTTSRLASLTCIDPRSFDDNELLEIDAFFDASKTLPLMDIHECVGDPNRAAIDRFVIEKMLKPSGALAEQVDAMQLVRAKLAAEPTVRGGR